MHHSQDKKTKYTTKKITDALHNRIKPTKCAAHGTG